MSAMAPQITGISIICSTVCSGADQRKHQRSTSLTLVKRMHRWPMDSPHKGPVTRKMFPFDNVVCNEWNQHPLTKMTLYNLDKNSSDVLGISTAVSEMFWNLYYHLNCHFIMVWIVELLLRFWNRYLVRADSAPIHYRNQCWSVVNWTIGKKLQWNFNRNSNIFIQ